MRFETHRFRDTEPDEKKGSAARKRNLSRDIDGSATVQRVGITSSASSFGLLSRNDAVSCRRPDYSVENVKEDGRENYRQHEIGDSSPQKESCPRRTLPAYFRCKARGLVSCRGKPPSGR